MQKWRFFVVAALAMLFVAACAQHKAPEFRATDITGTQFDIASLTLQDHTGKARRFSDFQGKAVSVFFGYTQCPDVCPTNMTAMAQVMKLLGTGADRVQVLFVTVDPQRDTEELLARYVPVFDARFLGLRGDEAATKAAAAAFKVFYQKAPGKTESSYTMDHTAGTYLLDPQGRLRLYVRHGAPVEDIAHDLRLLLAGN